MVKINGENVDAVGGYLLDYLKQNNYNINRIAVEINQNIILKKDFGTTVLKAGDEVEIVSFVAGG